MFIFKEKILKAVFILILVVVLALILAWIFIRFGAIKKAPDYSVVYLATGDIYFGEFHLLPFPSLNNAWVLQKDNNGVGLAPLSGSVWKPAKEIKINPKQIVFWSKLAQDSAVVRALTSGQAPIIPQPNPQSSPSVSPKAK